MLQGRWPLCSCATTGPGVIRIDDPRSEVARDAPCYLVWDRGKERVFLDLSELASDEERIRSSIADPAPGSSDLRERYRQLVGMADVLVEGFPASSPHQSLVDYRRLSSLNRRLVQCSITAYGLRGPLKDEPPIDELVMARTGILHSMPGFRPGPVHVVHPVPTVGAALLAAQGIVASLYAREKTGRGRKVETSLMAGALLFAPRVSGEKLSLNPLQFDPAGSAPFYSVFECADGNWIQLGCVHAGFVRAAAAVMGIENLIDDPRFNEGRPSSQEAHRELSSMVSRVIMTKTLDQWPSLFEEADVPYAPAHHTEEAIDDPQVLANEMVVQLQDPVVGPILQMGLPLALSRTPGKIRCARAVPGQDTEKVIRELKRDDGDGGVGGPEPGAMDPPLKGIKILEITNLIAGPTAGKCLADLGADVVKMEPLGGDISRPLGRAYFHYLNANKRSLSINTRAPEGREVAQRLARKVDVLLANLRPGATDRMGIGIDSLGNENAKLIETHVTGYGWSGPYAHRPGIDPMAQALIGLSRAQGGPDNPPVFLAQLAPTDYTAGAMGALGTVLALFVRERTGLVQKVDTNLLNGGIVLSADAFTRYEGKPARRLADKGQYGLHALHRLYQTGNGWIYLAVDSQDQWERLCTAVGRPELVGREGFRSSAQRLQNDAHLAEELAETFGVRPAEEWVTLFGQVGVPCAPVVEDHRQCFFSDPQIIANELLVEYPHPTAGRVRLFGNAVRFRGTADIEPKPTPLLGQHTVEILRDLRYSDAEIKQLHDDGVVKTEGPGGLVGASVAP